MKPHCPLVCAILAVILSSCGKDEAGEGSYGQESMLTVSTAVVVASAGGGTYSFTYAVVNPVSGGEVSCAADDGWIGGIDCSRSRTVSFTVDENASARSREGRLTLSYSYGGRAVSCTVTVAQNAAGTPVLTVPSALTVSEDGGECSFSYTVDSPVPDGVLSCAADADWAGNFDLSEDGSVSLTVDANTETTLRSCEVTLSYTYDGGLAQGIVTLVQNHSGGGLSVEDLIGTYEASGMAYNPYYDGVSVTDMFVETTWTMTVYENYSPTVVIDGIVPATAGYYDPEDEEPLGAYIAEGFLDSYGRLIVPSQFSGYVVSVYGTYYYLGYTPCTGYDGTSVNIDTSGPDCVFTYDPSAKTWTSDGGLLLGLFSSYSFSSMSMFSDAVVSDITFRKTDSATAGVRPAPRKMATCSNFKIR